MADPKNDAEQRRLEDAMRELEAVLTKYDLMGFISLLSQDRAHWAYLLDASWSCASYDPKTGGVRIRAKAADFKTSEQHHEVVHGTLNALFGAKDLAIKQAVALSHLCERLRRELGVQEGPPSDVRVRVGGEYLPIDEAKKRREEDR